MLSQKPSESVSVDLLSLRPLKMIDCGRKIFPTAGLLQKILMEKNSYVVFVNLGRVSDKEERGEKVSVFYLFIFLPKLFIYNVIVQ